MGPPAKAGASSLPPPRRVPVYAAAWRAPAHLRVQLPQPPEALAPAAVRAPHALVEPRLDRRQRLQVHQEVLERAAAAHLRLVRLHRVVDGAQAVGDGMPERLVEEQVEVREAAGHALVV